MGDKNKQTTFTHQWIDEDEVTQTGTFTAKRLSVMGRSKLATRRSQLSGGMYCVRNDEGEPTGQGIDPDTDYINTMIAHLELALVQKPIWFKLEELTDMGLVADVYDKVLKFEMTFFDEETGAPLTSLKSTVTAAKQIAVKNLRSKRLIPQLRRWWTKKYKLPWTHDAAQCQSELELLIEYYEDYFEEDKAAYYKELGDEDGNYILPETGDELIDKWEREISQGLTPDLEEGLTPKARAELKKEKEQAVHKTLYKKALGAGFEENYSAANVAVLGKKESKSTNQKIMDFAQSGGLKNLDPATAKRMLDALSPAEAEQIIQILKNR